MIGVVGHTEVDHASPSEAVDPLDEPVPEMFALVRNAVGSATEIFLNITRRLRRTAVES